MKPRLKSLLLLLPLLFVAAIPSPQNITLAWDDPDTSPDNTYKLYTSSNITVPITNWDMIRLIPGTNRQVTIQVTPSKAFYYLTKSNFWGESDPSNVVGTPAPPTSGTLTVRKGP